MTISHADPSAQRDRSSPAPLWVSAAELACLGLIVLALFVAISGGSRLRLFGLRVSLTSPYRLLFWTVAVSAVRFFGARDVPIQLPRLFTRWCRPPAVRAATATFLGTRPAILFVGYLAVIMLGYPEGGPQYRVSTNEFVNLPMRWDAGWYMNIVTDGYVIDRRSPLGQQNIVFFPAYPMIVRAVADQLGGKLTRYIFAGLFVSFAAFFGALVYLYALARETLDDEEAQYALWLIGAYPFAVFFGAVYTESLFLLSVAATFYHFTRRQFWRASLWGLLIGLTRAPGCLMSIPLAILAVEPWLPRALAGHRAKQQLARYPLAKALAAAAAPVVGVLIYSAFIWRLTGNPLAWASGHGAWGRHYQGLIVVVTDRYNYIANAGVASYVSELPQDLLNGLGAAFVVLAALPVARRLGVAYAALILVSILPPLAAGGLLSAGRFSSVLFPAFIWLASAIPRQHRAGWIASFAALQALVAALFYTWRPLY
jgi:hypothetical protein